MSTNLASPRPEKSPNRLQLPLVSPKQLHQNQTPGTSSSERKSRDGRESASPKRLRARPNADLTEYEALLRETYPDSALADEIYFGDDDDSQTPKRRRRRQDSDGAWTSPQSLRTPLGGQKPTSTRLTMSAESGGQRRGRLSLMTKLSPNELMLPIAQNDDAPEMLKKEKEKSKYQADDDEDTDDVEVLPIVKRRGRPKKNSSEQAQRVICSPTQSSSDQSTPHKDTKSLKRTDKLTSSPRKAAMNENATKCSPEKKERKRRVRLSLEEAVRETIALGVPSLKRPRRGSHPNGDLEIIEKLERGNNCSPNRPRRSLAVYKNVSYSDKLNGHQSEESDITMEDISSSRRRSPRKESSATIALSPRRRGRSLGKKLSRMRRRSKSSEPVLIRTMFRCPSRPIPFSLEVKSAKSPTKWQSLKPEPLWGFGVSLDEVNETADVFECRLQELNIEIQRNLPKKYGFEVDRSLWKRVQDDTSAYRCNLERHRCARRNRSSSPTERVYVVTKGKERKAMKKKRRLTSDEFEDESFTERSTMSPEKYHISREFSDFLMKGLSKGDYRMRMQGVISMYKYMSLRDWRGRTVYQPFLYRNHWVYASYKDRLAPRDYAIYFEEPPFAWPERKVTRRRQIQRTDRQKAHRLDSIIEMLVDGGRTLKKARRDLCDDEVSFSTGTLVNYKWHGKEALLSDSGYRKKLIRDGVEILPERKYFPNKEPERRLYRFFSPSPKKQPVVKEDTPTSAVYVHSAKIGRIIHNILPGTRNAKVEMYTIKKYGNKTMKPEKIGKFEMSVNAKLPDNRVADFMVTEPCDFDLLYSFFIITISPDKSQPELVKKRSIEAEKETVYYCGRSVYESERIRQHTYGFLKGYINMCLVPGTECRCEKTDWRIMEEIEQKAKKTDGMAFFQIELFTDVIGGNGNGSEASFGKENVKKEPSEGENQAHAEIDVKGTIENGEEKRNPVISILSVYTGKYKDEKRYVNDYRILEDLFNKDIEAILSGDANETQALREYFSFRPSRILYRIFSHLSKKKMEEEDSELEHLMNDLNNEEPTLTRMGDLWKRRHAMKFVETMQVNHTTTCIICERKFLTTFALLMHYHLSYPRLTVQLAIHHTFNKRNERVLHPVYDIFLDPHFKDVQEAFKVEVITRRDPEPPQFLVIKAESIQLKQQMRMDMALFTTLLTDPSPTLKKRVEQTAFVNPRDGRLLAPYAKAPFDVNAMPHTLAEVGHYITSEKIGQFIDISDGAKAFMIMWNTFVNKFGPPRCREIGRYMLTKLFMKFYLPELRKTEWGLRMLKLHISSDAFYERINTYDWIDLARRVRAWDEYDPLEHGGSGIYTALLECLEAGHKKFKKTMDRHPLTDRRTFPRVFRKNLEELKANRKELRKAMETCLRESLFSQSRPERLYLEDPVEYIFGSERIPTCFKNWKGM